MNVFVLSTGRCGSTAFERACSHIENYSCGHETLTHLIGPKRLEYPNWHIESDNRLSWFLGRLDEAFGDKAFYVHLLRSPNDVAQSYAKRYWVGSIMHAYTFGILLRRKDKAEHVSSPKLDAIDIAHDYVNTVNSNIRLFLKGKTNFMTFQVENFELEFQSFWHRINAQGNLSAALSEFKAMHNASL
jgi:hypothetical protein